MLSEKIGHTHLTGKIAVWKEHAIFLLKTSDILYITVESKKTAIHARDGIYETRSSLDTLELKLSDLSFFRSHKSFIVNMNYVEKIIPWFNATYMMLLGKTPEQIPVSRRYVKKLREMLYL